MSETFSLTNHPLILSTRQSWADDMLLKNQIRKKENRRYSVTTVNRMCYSLATIALV